MSNNQSYPSVIISENLSTEQETTKYEYFLITTKNMNFLKLFSRIKKLST